MSSLTYGDVDPYPYTVVYNSKTHNYYVLHLLLLAPCSDEVPDYNQAESMLLRQYVAAKATQANEAGVPLPDVLNLRSKELH